MLLDVHNAHLPPGVSRGLIKAQAFEAIRLRIDTDTQNARVLCGDFNAPVRENVAGPISEGSGPWTEPEIERWKLAEKRVVDNPEMRDVYRDVHARGLVFPVSHFTGRIERPTAHRYDHVFASSDMQTESCVYLSHWLERTEADGRLSDHAPVEAHLSVARTC